MEILGKLRYKRYCILLGVLVIVVFAKYILVNAISGGNEIAPKEISLEKLDKVSAYKIKYTGDYKFEEFLKKGVKDESELYDFLNNNGLNPHKNLISYTSNNNIFGCSCFTVKNQNNEVFFGRNFDWYSHPCTLVYTSPKGAYSSVSMVDLYYTGASNSLFGDKSVSSKYLLSVPYIPLDGINEKGVAVGVMSLPRAQSSNDADKKTISSLGAVRLVLDYAANVDEAISLMGKYNIFFQKEVPIHYMISDSTGKSVIIEYVEGKMNIIPNEQPWQVSTNFVLSGYGKSGRGLDRYDTANKELSDSYKSITKTSAMGILKDVSQGYTCWSIVYDLKKKDFDLCIATDYGKVLSSSLF